MDFLVVVSRDEHPLESQSPNSLHGVLYPYISQCQLYEVAGLSSIRPILRPRGAK